MKHSYKILFGIILLLSLIISYSEFKNNEKNKKINYFKTELNKSNSEVDSLKNQVKRVNNLYLQLLHNMKSIGNVDVTVYQPVKSQTNNRYWETADQSIINLKNPKALKWIAISRNLHVRWGGPLEFGDYVWVTGIGKHSGLYKVHDIMNKRFRDRIDILIGKDDNIYSYINNADIQLYKIPKESEQFFAEQENYSSDYSKYNSTK